MRLSSRGRRAGGASIAIEIGKPIKARKFGSRLRMHGLGLGTSLSLSLIWSPSYAKCNAKTFFGLLRVNLLVVDICKNIVLLQSFFFSHVFS